MNHSQLIGLMFLALSAATPTKDQDSAVRFPTGYREWNHLGAMAITSDKHPLFNSLGGLHQIYGNDLALKAARAKTTYPDGAILVLDLLEWTESEGAYTQGKRKLVAVMAKDSKRFKTTGGWGFEGFKSGDAKQRTVTDTVTQCYNCHATRKDHDSVFSEWRD